MFYTPESDEGTNTEWLRADLSTVFAFKNEVEHL